MPYVSRGGIAYRSGGAFGRVPLSGKPEYSIRSKTNAILRLAQEVEGQFRWPGGAFSMALGEANETLAIKVQQGIVEKLNRDIAGTGRPQMGRLGRDPHPAGALAATIANKGNRFANASGYMVGIPSFLDKSPVKRYWRRIEEGHGPYEARGFFWDGLGVGGKQGPFAPNPAMNRMNARFPQGGLRARPIMVKAWPGYHYTQGGRDALRSTNIPQMYADFLKARGITVTTSMFRNGLGAGVRL